MLDLFIVLRSRMSGIGSLRLDSRCCCCCCCFLTLTDPLRIQPWSQDRRNQTKSNRESEIVLCVISCRGQSIVTGNGGTLESYYIGSPVLHQEASLQKICALEKKQATKKLIISSCTPTTSALLLYHYLLYYCCMACRYCQQCCDTSVHATVVSPLLYVYVPL